MSGLPTIKRGGVGGALAEFQPQQAKANDAKANAVIDYAKRVQDWPLLEQAVDQKIEDQEEFECWWTTKVRRKGGEGGVQCDNAESALSVEQAENLTGISQQQVSRWRKHLQDKPKYRDRLMSSARRKADLEAAENHRALSTGEFEWYTPSRYVEAARKVMGGIDLDPASCEAAQRTIQATKWFSQTDNGLEHSWGGRVWLNPPYSQPAIWHFVEKLVAELCANNAKEAILLTHNYTDTSWFHHAESIALAICFTRGRIRFVDSDGVECASPTQGQAFFYYGEDDTRFREVFSDFGFVR